MATIVKRGVDKGPYAPKTSKSSSSSGGSVDPRSVSSSEIAGAGQYTVVGYQTGVSTPAPSRTGGGGGGGSRTSPSQPTETEKLLGMSIADPNQRNLPQTPAPSRTISSQIKIDKGTGSSSVEPRQPTAKEQVFQMSFPDPVTDVGKTKTTTSFKEDIFYKDIYRQQQEFQQAGQGFKSEQDLISYSYINPNTVGMSTPEGSTLLFSPDVEFASNVAGQAYKELPLDTRIGLRASDILYEKIVPLGTGSSIRELDIQSQFKEEGEGTFGSSLVGGFAETAIVNPVKGVIKGGAYIGSLGYEIVTGNKALKSIQGDTTGFDYSRPIYKDPEIQSAGVAVGTGFIIGGGLRFVGAGLRTISPGVAPVVEKIITGGLAISTIPYVAGKGAEIALAKDKGTAIGETAGEFALLGGGGYLGSKFAGTSIGLFRTRGMVKLPAESVVAPEFYEGQKFPQIKPGETPRQLKGEFFEFKLPGESPVIKLKGYTGEGTELKVREIKELPVNVNLDLVPKGFSARPIPFQETIGTGKVRAGELEGGYFAPDVNPYFFRGSSFPRLFSIGEFGRLPTAERVAFSGIEYAPGVRGGQKGLRKPFSPEELSKVNEAFSGTGKGVLGFIKSEKEVVLVPETKVTPPTKRFFFEDPLTGERVPIFERKAIVEREYKGFEKPKTLRDIETILPEKPAYLTSSKVGGYSLVSSGLRGYQSSYINKVSSVISQYSFVSSPTSSTSKVSSKVSSAYSRISSPISQVSSVMSSYASSFARGSYIPPANIGGGILGTGRGTSQIGRQKTGYSPSITGAVLNIKGTPGKVLGGYDPFTIRGYSGKTIRTKIDKPMRKGKRK